MNASPRYAAPKETRFLVENELGRPNDTLPKSQDQTSRKQIMLKHANDSMEMLVHLQKSLQSVMSCLNEYHIVDSSVSSITDQKLNDVESRLTLVHNSINVADKCLAEISPDVSRAFDACSLNLGNQEFKDNYNFLMTGKIDRIQDLLTDMAPVGHGGEGRVFRGRLRHSKQPVVVKSYFMDCEQSSRIEFAIMTLAKNVLGVKRPIALVNTPSNFFLIVQDELNTVPLDTFVANQTLTDLQIQCIFSQMARILHDLTEKFIKHRDIKLENFLLNVRTGHLSIIDFGWSMYSAIDFVSIDEVRRSGETLMGTTDYLPPESNSPPGTIVSYEKAAVYALGCILLELFFGYQGRLNKIMPQKGISMLLTSLVIKTGRKIPKGTQNLLNKCTRIDPMERLSLEGVLNHPWVLSDRRDLKLKRFSLPSSKHKFKSYEL